MWVVMENKLDLDIGAELIDNNTSDDYYTPPFIFEQLGLQFDLDVAAPVGGVPWIPARNHYSILDDGLSKEWFGVVWCNPPYSDVTPWAKRMMAHGSGIALVQTAKSAWFNEMWGKADGALILMPNLKFVRGNGQSAPIFMPAMLFAFGDAPCLALNKSELGYVR